MLKAMDKLRSRIQRRPAFRRGQRNQPHRDIREHPRIRAGVLLPGCDSVRLLFRSELVRARNGPDHGMKPAERLHAFPRELPWDVMSADMRHFVITGGVPCVMFGAGDVRLAHAPDESIPLEDLLTAITTTALLIANWCGVS